MRSTLLVTTALVAVATSAQAQTMGSGTINGLRYQTMTPPGGCTTATPCQILEYLHPLGEESQVPAQLQRYFNTLSFWAANPHTMIVAPQINGSTTTNNWGDVTPGINGNMTAAVDLVKQVQTAMPTTGSATLTGGSMGAIGGEQLMSLYGPKGSQQAGVYGAGLFYDGAPYQISAASAKSTLCGVPLTIVHGTADKTVDPGPDQTMAQTLSGCSGFNFISVPGASHGTYSNGAWGGYEAGTLINQTLAAGRTSGATSTPRPASSTTLTASPTTTAAIVGTSPASNSQPAPSIEAATIKPDGGSITDAQGHVWLITPSGSIMEDGQYTPGGGGTAALTVVNGTVYGLDDGHGPVSPGSWFTLDGAGQNWAASDPPSGATGTAGTAWATPPATPTAPLAPPSIQTPTVCGNGTPTGSFHAADGHFLGPDGKEWIARGINVADSDLGAADQMIAMFPGLNFVRLAIYQYRDPSFYAAFISKMTARGTVVEIEHHVEPNGATGGGGQGATASGAWLAAENAFYSAVAAAFKSNPYVWFGTTNEPPGPSGLSAWQAATYKAIRDTGNNAPILLQANGWAEGGQPVMLQGYDLSAYSNMTNVVWDVHYYGWLTGYSTDQQKSDAFLAKMIDQVKQVRSADGSIPAMVVEYGPSTTGQSMDANGMQTVDAVINSSAAKQPTNAGNAAWHWAMQDCCNNLNSGTSLTDLGQRVALYIGTSVQPCSAAEAATNAQNLVAAVTAQVVAADAQPATDAPAPTTPAPASPVATDPAIAALNRSADASIAQADAIIAAAQQRMQATLAAKP